MSLSVLTLMMIDSCDDFRTALYQELKDCYTIHQYRTGSDALEAVSALIPDVIVTDLFLAGVDGITLLYKIRDAGLRPMVLATTKLFNDYVFECAEELGISYIIRKPCDPKAVAQRVRDLSKRLNPKTITDPQAYLRNRLQALCFSSRHKGYHYLLEAVLIKMNAPETAITKELYPAIGLKFHSSAAQVERSIRSAVNAAWEHHSAAWTELFPAEPGQAPERPSNGELIFRLSEELRLLTEDNKPVQDIPGAGVPQRFAD